MCACIYIYIYILPSFMRAPSGTKNTFFHHSIRSAAARRQPRGAALCATSPCTMDGPLGVRVACTLISHLFFLAGLCAEPEDVFHPGRLVILPQPCDRMLEHFVQAKRHGFRPLVSFGIAGEPSGVALNEGCQRHLIYFNLCGLQTIVCTSYDLHKHSRP